MRSNSVSPAWRARSRHEVLGSHSDAWLSIDPRRWAVAPFCQGGDRVTTQRNGTCIGTIEVQRHAVDLDRRRSTLRDEGQQGLDSCSLGHRSDCTYGDSGEDPRIADICIHDDRRPLLDSRRGGIKFQGVTNMADFTSLLAVASGYIIAFAIGAWIGRPLLGLLTDKIFKK